MHKRKKLVKRIAYCAIVCVLLVIIWNAFKIKRIDCQTQYGVCSTNIHELFSEYKGRSLFLSLPQSHANELVANLIQVKSVELLRKFPQTLIANVTLRTPIGAVVGENAPDMYGLVDEDGKVVSTVSETTISVLTIKEWQPTINQLAPIHVASLKVLATISQLDGSRVNGEVTDLGLVVNSNGVTIIVDPKMPVLDWYSSLQVIVDRSKIQNKLPRKIDLRFNQPVLEY